MLYLSRQKEQAVMIGDTIMVTILKVRRRSVDMRVTYVNGPAPPEPSCAAQTIPVGETLWIRDKTVGVHVRHSGRCTARLGFVAPDSVPIYRLEVYDRIKAEEAVA